MPLNLKR